MEETAHGPTAISELFEIEPWIGISIFGLRVAVGHLELLSLEVPDTTY